MQCHLRCDCGNTKNSFAKTNVRKMKNNVSMSSIIWMPFVNRVIVTFIDLTCTCLMIKVCILSLPAYLHYSELKEPHFLVRSSLIL